MYINENEFCDFYVDFGNIYVLVSDQKIKILMYGCYVIRGSMQFGIIFEEGGGMRFVFIVLFNM